MKINGHIVTASEFAWDGCHKIYLINNDEDKHQLAEYGYDFYPITALRKAWKCSCPLRFICDADLKRQPVGQCENARFTAN